MSGRQRRGGVRGAAVAVAAFTALALPPAPAANASTVAGPLRARADGGGVRFTQPGHPGATLELTATSPHGLAPKLKRIGRGMIRVGFAAPHGTRRISARFARPGGERFLGFGERSDAVVRRHGTVTNRVTEGPYRTAELPAIKALVPPPGYTARRDATYFPVPWLVSTRGYGVLIENDDESRFQLGSPWSAQADGRRLSLLIVAGPQPRDVVRRFSARVGRQPPTKPTALGPWWQPGSGGIPDSEWLQRLRSAGALGSVAQTYTHYLPCASQVGKRDSERDRVALFHKAGLDVTTYFNPMICTDHPRYAKADSNGWLTKDAGGRSYTYHYTGSRIFDVGQIDFTAPGAIGFYRRLTNQALADGHDGWMEDFGEYTPDDAVEANGETGTAAHNAYAREYHLGVWRATHKQRLLRFARSGWTGSAAGSPIVWGGDPTTDWGFDGLTSAVRNGLSMGLSGVSRWGSDIGGYFALSVPETTPELLDRWIEFGFASGVMRTEGNGFDLGEQIAGRRAQIIDPEVLPIWARWAKLRTRFLPELQRYERIYDRTGMPVMRQLALAYPNDPRAVGRDDEYMFGDSILVAPVLNPGATERKLYLPRGRWIDLRSVADPHLQNLQRAKTVRGGREVTVPAPLADLPMFVRAGSELELLPNGGPSWRDAVQRGRGSRRMLAFKGHVARVMKAPRSRYFLLQWQLPRRPRKLTLDGERVPFIYRNGVLHAHFGSAGGRLRVSYRKRR